MKVVKYAVEVLSSVAATLLLVPLVAFWVALACVDWSQKGRAS